MTYLLTKTLFSTNGPVNLCSKWYGNVNNFPHRLDLLLIPKQSFKNNIRVPERIYDRHIHKRKNVFGLSVLIKPLCWTLAFSGISLAGATIWQYENINDKSNFRRDMFFSISQHRSLRQKVRNWWLNLSEGNQVFIPICFLNVLVFLAWKIPALHPFMRRYFLSGVSSDMISASMVLSTFSHFNLLHIGANMFCLHGFVQPAVSFLGKEQFLGVYLSAAAVSSFASLLYKVLTKSRAMSLGASGAVMCVLGYFCLQFPEQQLSIIFIPHFTFDAATGLKYSMLLDFAGCFLKWTFIDHAGHLGGSLFGVFWYYFGQPNIWDNRSPLIDAWHSIRTNSKDE